MQLLTNAPTTWFANSIKSSSGITCYRNIALAIFSASIGAISSCDNFAFAQLASDTTLGAESSVITPLNPSVDQIDGGASRGVNLFHSFQEFNIGEGREVYFSNPPGVENILSRVTGGNPSNILGKLGVLGNANLFLINPNGIIFGQNASLNVGGSFLATTANAIQFDNQGIFSASTPNVPPVLTINPSALLFNQIEAGAITNNSKAPAGQRLDLDPTAQSQVRNLVGLRVPDGKSLVLLGGNVNLIGGGLNALNGRVELASVATGIVGLDVNGNNLSLSIPNDIVRADISLTNTARVDVSGEGSGNIQLHGRNITLNSGSQITADTLGSKQGGTLNVSASDSVNLNGRVRGGNLSTRTFSDANAGNLTISARKLVIQNGAQVITDTTNKGSGGNLTVNALESIELIGTTTGGTPSGLFSVTAAAGNAGNITINTGKLIVQDGARISTESSRGVEDASGNSIPATGKGGDLTVNASDSVEVIGTSLREPPTPSSLLATTQGDGDAGNLTINTGRLLVQNGAEVSVGSARSGNAGNLNVTAGSINLEEQGRLTATIEELGKGGGNITLNDLNLLLLRNGIISTSALGTANGGDITINADVIAAIEVDNITATAVEGRGGRIKITTQGLFLSPDSRIDASSEQGLDGLVEINRPEADPRTESIALPAQVVDVSGLVAEACPAGGGNLARGSKFVVTGRGGLPPTPSEVTRSDAVLVDLGTPVQSVEDRLIAAIPTNNSTISESAPLVEANGWMVGNNGEVVLTASASNTNPEISKVTPNSCRS